MSILVCFFACFAAFDVKKSFASSEYLLHQVFPPSLDSYDDPQISTVIEKLKHRIKIEPFNVVLRKNLIQYMKNIAIIIDIIITLGQIKDSKGCQSFQ